MPGLAYRTLRENVVEAIRMKILNQELKPGDRIVEMELAAEFHTSRGPIREALRQLENEGMVEYVRNVGCSVKNIEAEDSYEIYIMRVNFEILAIKLMKGKYPEESLENMERILKKMKKLTEKQYDEVFPLDNEFHAEIIKMPGFERLYKVWKELSYGNILSGYTHDILNKQEVVERQYRVHYPIYEALAAGDEKLACKEIAEHYFRTIQRLKISEGASEGEIKELFWEFLL